MTRETFVSLGLVALTCVGLYPAAAFAQSGSSILGTVKDTTGAVLPGVTVEVSSPALIEKARSIVTDAEGVYRVIELRPGTYTVTFTLAGFSTLKREGLELPAAFTATVNAELKVGGLEETVTVSGAAPLVDTRAFQQRRVLTAETTEGLPAIQRAPAAYAVFLPGVIKDEATSTGTSGEPNRDLRRISIRGASTSDNVETLDGAKYPMLNAGGGFPTQYYFNMGNSQEVVVDTSGLGIESQLSGMVTNIVPKEGGNTYHGDFIAAYSSKSLSQNNLTQDLINGGLKDVNRPKKFWDYNASWGGPLRKDKLWFWNSFRYWGTETYQAGVYFNKTLPPAWAYTPDLNRQFVQRSVLGSSSLRTTWQAAEKHKISAFFDYNPTCFCDRSNFEPIQSPEATDNWYNKPNTLMQLTWKAPVASRLFLQANTTIYRLILNEREQFRYGTDDNVIPALDQTLAIYYRALVQSPTLNMGLEKHSTELYRASANYVTSSHNAKVGFELRHGLRTGDYRSHGGSIQVGTRNFVPFQIIEVATPFLYLDEMKADGGVFAGDDWTLKRVTVSPGVRWEYLIGRVPAQSVPAGPFVPARTYAAVEDVPSWRDVSPRFAAAWDVFGDGKTAIKGTWGRYVAGEQVGPTRSANPQTQTIVSVTRNWTDTNGNFSIDCDLNNRFQNGECQQVNNLNFGLNNPNATQFDRDVISGYGKRSYSWEQTIQVERQLGSNVSATVGYFRREYYNTRVNDNLLVTPADYDPFCVTAPLDSRLPHGGGYQVCGLYDITPSKFGQSTLLTTLDSNYGKRTQISDYVEINGTVRLPRGGQARGGVSTGRLHTETCFTIDSPQALLNCDNRPPFKPDWKALVVYPLPWWGLQVGATFANTTGNEIAASWTAPASAVQGLGRPLASGANATVVVPLIPPGTQYSDRRTQLDSRITKRFRVGPSNIEGSLDLNNLFNSSGVLGFISTYGGNWLVPRSIQFGRSVKLTARVTL